MWDAGYVKQDYPYHTFEIRKEPNPDTLNPMSHTKPQSREEVFFFRV
jgi:hypothetical protein